MRIITLIVAITAGLFIALCIWLWISYKRSKRDPREEYWE